MTLRAVNLYAVLLPGNDRTACFTHEARGLPQFFFFLCLYLHIAGGCTALLLEEMKGGSEPAAARKAFHDRARIPWR